MEFEFDLKFLKSDINGISVWNGKFHQEFGTSIDNLTHFCEIVNKMGIGSYKAQGLGQPVTSSYSLRGTNHTLYIICDNHKKIKGILKIGYKKLFIHDLTHQYTEMTPLCVLDFYVHESCQRKGIGKYLFQFMLKSQNTEPRLLAYDAPSPKLLNFLSKYYGLKSFTPQNCAFVVYHDYFQVTDTYHYEILKDDQMLPQTPPPNKIENQSVSQNPDASEQNHDDSELQLKYQEEEIELVENEEKAHDNNHNRVSSIFHHQTVTTSHDKQLESITKQIEQTKLELRDTRLFINNEYSSIIVHL